MTDFFVTPDGVAFRPILGGGGGDVNVPGPTEEERDLQRQQTEILKQQHVIIERQVRQQDLLAPILFEEAGIIPTIDPETGEIIGFETDPEQAALKEQRSEIEKLFLQRSKDALEGNLPVNPALERDLKEGEEELRERLRKQLGRNFETSSPGIEALGDFFERGELIREGARRGDLTLAEQLGQAREGTQANDLRAFLSNVTGVNTANISAIQPFSQVVGGLHNVEGSFAAQRQLETQALISGQQSRASTLGALFGAIGTGAGIGAGIAFKG